MSTLRFSTDFLFILQSNLSSRDTDRKEKSLLITEESAGTISTVFEISMQF